MNGGLGIASRDVAIEQAVAELAELHLRVREVESERATYREVACAALEGLHALTVQLGRARETIARLLDERRKPHPGAA